MYQIIVNPNARGGRGIKIWKTLEGQLNRAGVEYHAYLTGRSGDAKVLASQLTERINEPCCIVVVGGDGTLCEVINGLSLSSAVTLGYIPVGRTDDFARSMGLPRKPKASLKRIINPKQIKMVDYGVITYGSATPEHQRFLVSAGIGFDPLAGKCALSQNADKKLCSLHIRWIADLIMTIRQIVGITPVKGYLLLDGIKKVELGRLYFVSANVHLIARGGFKIAPRRSDSNDGILTLCVVHSTSKLRLIPMCLRARFWHLRRNRGVRFYECREALIHMEQPRPVHADGTAGCQTDMHIRCIEKKLQVIK